jgi:hypothetical protein
MYLKVILGYIDMAPRNHEARTFGVIARTQQHIYNITVLSDYLRPVITSSEFNQMDHKHFFDDASTIYNHVKAATQHKYS